MELVAEGFDDPAMRVFPNGAALEDTRWRCVVDPIDGTRGIMYDKRPAWVLAGLAPQRGDDTRLPDIFAAAMTEIPTASNGAPTRSARCGGGAWWRTVWTSGRRSRGNMVLRASEARDFRHGFASLAKFFPAGKTAVSRIEEELWRELYGSDRTPGDF